MRQPERLGYRRTVDPRAEYRGQAVAGGEQIHVLRDGPGRDRRIRLALPYRHQVHPGLGRNCPIIPSASLVKVLITDSH